jgi:uncharacterized protein (DUF305 family)
MRTSKAGPWTAVWIAAALLATGCGGGGSKDGGAQPGESGATVVQPGAPGEESRVISADEAVAAGNAIKHTGADIAFMRGMIHHHAQALVMTNMVRERSRTRAIPLFARRIQLTQETEIERMEQWLTDRGQQPPTDEEHRSDHGGMMPGMLSEDELSRLAAAQGRAFDDRFLRAMRRHHRGALQMVEQLRADGGGMEPAIGDFTADVEADQGIELARIDQLLASKPNAFGVRRKPPSKAALERADRLAFAAGTPRICVLLGA